MIRAPLRYETPWITSQHDSRFVNEFGCEFEVGQFTYIFHGYFDGTDELGEMH